MGEEYLKKQNKNIVSFVITAQFTESNWNSFRNEQLFIILHVIFDGSICTDFLYQPMLNCNFTSTSIYTKIKSITFTLSKYSIWKIRKYISLVHWKFNPLKTKLLQVILIVTALEIIIYLFCLVFNYSKKYIKGNYIVLKQIIFHTIQTVWMYAKV